MRLDNISKAYGGITVFNAFSAELPNGKITRITGSSGCGKTTLLRIISGLEPFSGDISQRPSGKISAVFQEDRLFEELSAIENCLLVAKKPLIDIPTALIRTGLEKSDIRRPVKELSGGMRRRTAVVRALCPDFGMLLLDEPFKGIDRDNAVKTAELIGETAAGKTIIIVSHDMNCPLASDFTLAL